MMNAWKENCGSLFSELSVVEIKKASAAPRECVSTVVCYLKWKENCGSLFSELSVVEIKKASAAPRECVSTVVCYLKWKENCGSLFSELSVVEIKKASAAPRECVSTVVCYLKWKENCAWWRSRRRPRLRESVCLPWSATLSGSLFSELSVVEIKKASAARESVCLPWSATCIGAIHRALKRTRAPLESGRFLYPARTPTNTSHGAESTITTLGWVGKNDGDSGWGFGGLHGWFLTDLLSRAARGWMRVLVSRVLQRLGARAGGRMRSTSRDPEHLGRGTLIHITRYEWGVVRAYTLENGPEADETNSTPETEEMSDNRSPDLSFENEADGLLVESSASLLDVSLRVYTMQPELISVVTQTDDTRTSTETSTDIRDDDDKRFSQSVSDNTIENLQFRRILRGDMRLSEKGSVASLILEDAQGK
ncbi:hypothetical protein DPMN_034586 [Dreissena polymorpha]|uniref:Uncharacterized protein n=1 Tax=Dreissena polymorpha TaxID=45954 RepID=A0A9D4M852_DREPO|nr:hypothetical protein DPMN_034586 [Dreissena polymorpha]